MRHFDPKKKDAEKKLSFRSECSQRRVGLCTCVITKVWRRLQFFENCCSRVIRSRSCRVQDELCRKCNLKVDDASRAEGFESSCDQFLEWNNSGAECGTNSPTARLQCGEVRRLGKFLGSIVGKWHVQRMGKKVRDWYSEVGPQDIL